MRSKLIEATKQWFQIPMGMSLYYSWVYKNYWKPLLERPHVSTYEGEVGNLSEVTDDPFTQEEKIGTVSKGKEKEKGKERQREDDSLEKAYREQQRQQDRREYERNQQDYSDWDGS